MRTCTSMYDEGFRVGVETRGNKGKKKPSIETPTTCSWPNCSEFSNAFRLKLAMAPPANVVMGAN